MKKVLSFVFAIVLLLSCMGLTSCSDKYEVVGLSKLVLNKYSLSASFYVKEGDTQEKENANKAAKEIMDLATDIANSCNLSDLDSDLSRINTSKANTEVKVSSHTIKMIKRGKELYTLTNGAYNIAIYTLVDLYMMSPRFTKVLDIDGPFGFFYYTDSMEKYFFVDEYDFFTREDIERLKNNLAEAPSQDKINKVLSEGYLDLGKIIIDEENLTVTRLDERVKIDLGGISKGYLCDRAYEIAKKYDMYSGVINFAGNLYVIGGDIRNKVDWPVEIDDPNDQGVTQIGSINVNNKGVATSGTYQRFYWYKDNVYHHILDSKTGKPADTEIVSATIVCDSSADADALATSIIVLGLDKGTELLNELGYSALLLLNDGTYVEVGETQLNLFKGAIYYKK